jgi:hypothetical protein
LLITTEARGLSVFSQSARIEVSAAVAVVAELLRQHGRAVLNGLVPARLPTPETPYVGPVEVKPNTTRVFSVKQVKWSAPEGERFASKYSVLDLPPSVADRALSLRACVTLTDDTYRTFRGSYAPFNKDRETVMLGEAIESDAAPAPVIKAVAKAVPVAKEPTVRVFAVKPLRWKDESGSERACGKFVDCDLPAATAKRALACGAALELTNPARKANLGTWPGNYSLAACFDLDAGSPSANAAPQHDPIVHSAFQPIDRGKPFTLKIAGASS